MHRTILKVPVRPRACQSVCLSQGRQGRNARLQTQHRNHFMAAICILGHRPCHQDDQIAGTNVRLQGSDAGGMCSELKNCTAHACARMCLDASSEAARLFRFPAVVRKVTTFVFLPNGDADGEELEVEGQRLSVRLLVHRQNVCKTTRIDMSVRTVKISHNTANLHDATIFLVHVDR